MEDVNATDTCFGDLVREWRERRNMSQERLGSLTGRTGGYISQIESGTRGQRPRRDFVLSLAQALGAPAIDFLAAAGLDYRSAETGPSGRDAFEWFIDHDPLLRSDQRQILKSLYASFVGRSGR